MKECGVSVYGDLVVGEEEAANVGRSWVVWWVVKEACGCWSGWFVWWVGYGVERVGVEEAEQADVVGDRAAV